MKNITMKELPLEERPYEKLMFYGANSLSNSELLAIILKTGTKNETVLDVAQKILMLDSENSLSNISNLEINELMKVDGIGKVKAIQIKAVFELAKRIARPQITEKMTIKTSKDAYELLKNECINEEKEKLYVVNLNVKNVVMKTTKLASGSNAKVMATMANLFQDAIKLQASSIIIVHNHPSGDVTPSNADIEFTYKAIEAGKLLNIEVLDHIVISPENYVSMKKMGVI